MLGMVPKQPLQQHCRDRPQTQGQGAEDAGAGDTAAGQTLQTKAKVSWFSNHFVFSVSLFPVRRQRFRDIRRLAQGHTAGKASPCRSYSHSDSRTQCQSTFNSPQNLDS
jgi:hypothetical protein